MPGLANPAAVSATGEDVINRQIERSQPSVSLSNLKSSVTLEKFFELEKTVSLIKEHSFKRVALQFSDELLEDSVKVYQRLKELTDDEALEFYILADTSYGSCCVDEVAALHVCAQFIVHYGTACMTPTSRIPVQHVFGMGDIDVQAAASAALSEFKSDERESRQVVVMYDVVYEHAMAALMSQLDSKLFVLSKLRTDRLVSANDDVCKASSTNRYFAVNDAEAFDILYIGDQSLTLANIIINHNLRKVYSLCPATSKVQLESASVNRVLMKRYQLVQKVKDATVIGICVGTLGAELIEKVKHLILSAGKKPYLISVGKINPFKLGNFLEVEAFVFIACPEQIMVDCKKHDFYQPIVTPWELELALQLNLEWSSDYKTGIEPVLNTMNDFFNSEKKDADHRNLDSRDEDIPYYSLASGQLKARGLKLVSVEPKQALEDQMSTRTLTTTNKASSLVQWDRENSLAGAKYLKSRSWQGLSVDGDSSVVEAVPGRSGLPKGYDHEDLQRDR